MPEFSEKLFHFTNAMLRNAEDESAQLEKELERERTAALEEAKVEAKQAAHAYFEQNAITIRAESGQEISRHWMEGKRSIYLRRKQITEEVFQQVCTRLQEFTRSQEYPIAMERNIKSAIEQLHHATDMILFLRREDMGLAVRLMQVAMPVKITCKEGNFSLGGLILYSPVDKVRLNYSFDTRLEEQVEHFAELFGLSLSDELDET